MKEGRERIEFLTTSIGRGHRFYLAGLARSVLRLEANIDTSIHLAPAESGLLGKALWSAIQRAYKIGSSSGRVGKKYEKLRQTKRVGDVGFFEKLLVGGLKRFLTRSDAPLVVDHEHWQSPGDSPVHSLMRRRYKKIQFLESLD